MNKVNGKLPQRRTTRLPGYDYSKEGAYFVTVCTYQKMSLFGTIKEGLVQLNEFGRIVSDCWALLPSHFSNIHLDEFVIMPNHIHCIINICGPVGARPASPESTSNTSPESISSMSPESISSTSPESTSNTSTESISNTSPESISSTSPESISSTSPESTSSTSPESISYLGEAGLGRTQGEAGLGRTQGEAGLGRTQGEAGLAPTVNQRGNSVRIIQSCLQRGSIGAIIGSFKASVTKRINELRGSPGAIIWQRNYYERVVRNDSELIRTRRYIADNPNNWLGDSYHSIA
jgi:putative transposase